MARTKTKPKAHAPPVDCKCERMMLIIPYVGPLEAKCKRCGKKEAPPSGKRLSFGVHYFRFYNGKMCLVVERDYFTELVPIDVEPLRGLHYCEGQFLLDDFRNNHISNNCCKSEAILDFGMNYEPYSQGKRRRLVGRGICCHCEKPVRLDRFTTPRHLYLIGSCKFVEGTILTEVKKIQDAMGI